MALHFVTASLNGVKHVQSYNDAHYNAGTLGNGCYILPVRDKLQASMPDSNTVRILGGDFVVCGRHIAIDGGYEEVNIDNGIPGYNRIDLVVARVETAPSEKAELKVYKGEETTGTPVVPGHVEGDLNDGDTVCEMPICSVRVNGINPQAPEMLAKESIDIMALLQELRDYKSQTVGTVKLADLAVTSAKIAAKAVTKDKLGDDVWGWQAVGAIGYNGEFGTLYRCGRWAVAEIYCKKTDALAGWGSISAQLPGSVKPAFVARSALTCEDRPNYCCTGRATTDGTLHIENRSSTSWPASSNGFYITGSVLFVVA